MTSLFTESKIIGFDLRIMFYLLKQAMKESDIVEVVDNKMRKRDNPKMWPLPPNSPLTVKNTSAYILQPGFEAMTGTIDENLFASYRNW